MKFQRNYQKILKNFREIRKKILNNSRKIRETLLGKIEVIRNWYFWYYEEILESFSEIILMKLGKYYKEIFVLEKLWKNIENTSHKL